MSESSGCIFVDRDGTLVEDRGYAFRIEDYVRLAACYFCPHTPEDACPCRKPAPGLLERAARELGVELATSWMLGDTPADVETARRAGCRAVYLLTGQGRRRRAELPLGVPVAEDLVAAARLILASR